MRTSGMRIIELASGGEWSCNQDGQGVFSRRTDGTWAQHTGTGQTPTFATPQQLSRYIHRHYRDRDGESLGRMVGHRSWEIE
jgi:hypothetical protein